MTYKELKENIIQLGFEENDAFDSNPKMLLTAANRALIQLNQVEPKKSFKEIELLESEDYIKVNVADFDGFDRICEEPPKIKGKGYNDYYYEDTTLYIKGNGEKISIPYYSVPELIPETDNEDFNIAVPYQLYPMLQLLIAYYVWLDDDERKAIYYYNQYQEEANIYLQRKKEEQNSSFSAVVEGGIDI